jgi:glycosyltransferase A (GT-A) superfamily protein (DUF2064 family)
MEPGKNNRQMATAIGREDAAFTQAARTVLQPAIRQTACRRIEYLEAINRETWTWLFNTHSNATNLTKTPKKPASFEFLVKNYALATLFLLDFFCCALHPNA